MPTEVKICGLSSEEAVDAALEAGADLVGFVFFPRSPRNIAPARAAELARRLRGRAAIVALTVDADDALLDTIVAALRPDLLQLHGSETPERAAAIARRTGRPVMKTLSVAVRADLDLATGHGSAARFLLDAKAPQGATRPGGNATPFDWALLDGFAPHKPWLLAGGLAPGNVAAALAETRAPGVDVSSGVEAAPGRKSPDLIHAFVRAVRDFDRRREESARSRALAC